LSQKVSKSDEIQVSDLNSKQVVEYLNNHNDFFVKHPELLSTMQIPDRVFADSKSKANSVVDLQQVILGRLRKELLNVSRKHDNLIDSGRSNQQSQSRINTAVLRLLSARTLEHFVELMTVDLVGLLDIDSVALCLENGTITPAISNGIRILPNGTINKIISSERKVILRDNIVGNSFIFGETSGLVSSEAILRLEIQKDGPPAIFAMGSRHGQHFHVGQGTELLAFLADIMELCICRWLDLPH
jgi:hypothetical protein